MIYKNKKQKKEFSKKYYQEHKEEKRIYYQENKKRIDKKNKQWRLKNSERVKETKRKYCQTHKKERVEYQKQWRKDNPEKRKKYRKTYRKNKNKWLIKKRVIDPQFKLSSNISGQIRHSLKGKKAGCHWENLVGYTLKDLIIHLEARFDKNMNWQNQGSYWHIDHIKPQSLFKFENIEDPEFKKCWALSNLQPLEAMENLRKGNKI